MNKTTKKILFLFLAVIFFIKGVGQNSTGVKNTDTLKQTNDRAIVRGLPNVILKKHAKIYATLELEVRKNAVASTVTFHNDSQEDLWLYKPLLPDSVLIEKSFTIIGSDRKEVTLLESFISTNDYYYGNGKTWGAIIPVITQSNFILLRPKDSIKFTLILSKYFDFASKLKQGIKTFYVHYALDMPLIKNLAHIKEKDPFDNKVKPVYLEIGLLDKSKKDYLIFTYNL